MIIHRPAHTRGNPRADWINSYRTFSFPGYFDPKYRNFSDLQTINDDRVQPGGHVTADPITAIPYSTIAFTYAQLANQKTRENSSSPANPKIQDFRKQTNNDNPVIPFNPLDYQYNLQTYYGVGDPGKTDPRTKYTEAGFEYGVDTVNKINPFYFDPATQTPWEVA